MLKVIESLCEHVARELIEQEKKGFRIANHKKDVRDHLIWVVNYPFVETRKKRMDDDIVLVLCVCSYLL